MNIKFNFNSFKTVSKKESTRKGNGSVKRVCAFCGKEFITYPWRGAGKYCLINVLLMLLKLNIYLMLNVASVINLFILNLVDLNEVKQKCLLVLKNVWAK